MNISEVKKKTFAGIFWKFSERIIAQAVSLIVSIVLARLLTPDDYSVVGIVAIFFAFANVLISGGFNAALIQKKDADIEDYSTVMILSMSIAAVSYAVLFVSAPLIADLYDKDILIPVIRIMGLTLFINGFKSILCAYISSNMQFKKFFWATIVGTVISAAVGISLAMSGAGAWALVAQQMTNSFIDTVILFFTTKFKFKFKVSFDRLKGLFSYGSKIFISSLIHIIYEEVNPLIIGLRYSGADLSFYTKGRSFPSLINSTFGDTFSAVLFPAMSKLQDDKKAVLDYTRRFMKLSSFIIFPMMVGFFAVSDNFISLILTNKWLPAAIYIKIFCVCYMFNIIHTGNLQAIRAVGRSDYILIMEIIKKSSYFVVIVLFVFFSSSPETFAMAFIVNTVIATLVNTYPNRKLIGYSYGMQIIDLLKNLFTACTMGVCVYMMNYLPINKVLLLLLQIIVGVIVYAVLNLILKNENMFFLLSEGKKFIKRGNINVEKN